MGLVRPLPSFAIEVLPLLPSRSAAAAPLPAHSDHPAPLTLAAARPNCGEDPEIGVFDARGFIIPPEIARPLLFSSQLILLQASSAPIFHGIPALAWTARCIRGFEMRHAPWSLLHVRSPLPGDGGVRNSVSFR